MVVSSVHFLDARGRVLLSRDYRGDVSAEAAERLVPMLEEGLPEGTPAAPVLSLDGLVYVWLRHADLYVLGLIRERTAPPLAAATALVFLQRVVGVFGEYFGALTEESLRDNFVVVYELLDEMMDGGVPQATEASVLRELVTQQGLRLASLAAVAAPASSPAAIAGGGTDTPVASAVSWRREGIVYRKNEVFLDVVEELSVVMAEGAVVHTEIRGAVRARAQLSGMPELRLGLSERVTLGGGSGSVPAVQAGDGAAIELEDVRFHQCVRLNKFDAERTIAFVPPDGDFELMTYRVLPPVTSRPPFLVEAAIAAWTPSRIEIVVRIESLLRKRTSAMNVELVVPVPDDADSPVLATTMGSATYAPDRGGVVWSIGFFPAGRVFKMRARLGFPSVRASAADAPATLLPPMALRFEIPYHTASQMQVRYLKVVERSGYSALPWVRYVTQHGEYLVRMPEAASASSAAVLAAD